VRTNYDPVTPAQTAAGIGVVPNYFYQGLYQPLGTTFMDIGGSDSVSGTTTQLPAGQVAVYKYVLYKSTTNPAVTTAPGVVYYTDNTGTIVSGSPTDGYVGQTTAGAAADTAGIMMLNSTDLTTLTATLLNNGGNGSGVWICIGGFVKAGVCLTAGVAGDWLYGNTKTSGTAWSVVRVAAAGAAVASRQLGVALTTAAALGGIFTQDMQIVMGSTAPY
jgi:hypothetical protein